jgi:hypothetical protein
MLKLIIEEKIVGPLSVPHILRSLEDAVHGEPQTIDDVAVKIRHIPGLTCYRGGSHVAVHQLVGSGLGITRLAIVTREDAVKYHCHRCGRDNEIVNQCGCDPGNMPTRPR